MVVALVLSGASGCAETLSHRDIKPPFESPAPVEGRFDSRAPGFLIQLRPAADAVSVAHDLGIRYGFRHGSDSIRVEVCDAGTGFSDAERALEPFFTTKQKGMGLAICRSIVESHGGGLWAVNNSPHGATVAFTLPLVANKPA